jgi:uncharacterized protein YjbI with pentapeptide repeats
MASVDAAERPKRRNPIDLSGAQIPGTSLSHTNLAGSDFSHANLSRVNFEGSNLREADFREAKLIEANLTGTDLSKANLRDANLTGATLYTSASDGADMSHADLSDACIEGLDLSKVIGLTWRQFLEASFDETTVPPGYLTEEDLLQLLERTEPSVPWRHEFSGKVKNLLRELAAIGKSGQGGSILDRLMMIRVQREMDERQRERDD